VSRSLCSVAPSSTPPVQGIVFRHPSRPARLRTVKGCALRARECSRGPSAAPVTAGSVRVLRLPSIPQEDHDDGHSDHQQDLGTARATRLWRREPHSLRRLGPLPRCPATLPSPFLRQLHPHRLAATGCDEGRRLPPLAGLSRHVRRGEKGIAILAPIVSRLKVEDYDGEKRTIVGVPRAFRVVHVFHISQTDGDELPEIPCHRLDSDGACAELIGYAHRLGFAVETGEPSGETNGLCNHSTHTISLCVGLPPAQQMKTLAHEIAHASLHGDGFDGPRDQAELEAESVAYIVCALLGVDSAQHSWGYLASWGAGPDDIRRSAQAILDGVGVSPEAEHEWLQHPGAFGRGNGTSPVSGSPPVSAPGCTLAGLSPSRYQGPCSRGATPRPLDSRSIPALPAAKGAGGRAMDETIEERADRAYIALIRHMDQCLQC
jgi:hypothetical protein